MNERGGLAATPFVFAAESVGYRWPGGRGATFILPNGNEDRRENYDGGESHPAEDLRAAQSASQTDATGISNEHFLYPFRFGCQTSRAGRVASGGRRSTARNNHSWGTQGLGALRTQHRAERDMPITPAP